MLLYATETSCAPSARNMVIDLTCDWRLPDTLCVRTGECIFTSCIRRYSVVFMIGCWSRRFYLLDNVMIDNIENIWQNLEKDPLCWKDLNVILLFIILFIIYYYLFIIYYIFSPGKWELLQLVRKEYNYDNIFHLICLSSIFYYRYIPREERFC